MKTESASMVFIIVVATLLYVACVSVLIKDNLRKKAQDELAYKEACRLAGGAVLTNDGKSECIYFDQSRLQSRKRSDI